jgi:hypothetical protein
VLAQPGAWPSTTPDPRRRGRAGPGQARVLAARAAFCDEEFTIAELRRVYEAVWGTALDPRNFHRKVTGTPDFVSSTGETTTRDGGRPAQLYRVGAATLLHPAMLRPREVVS